MLIVVTGGTGCLGLATVWDLATAGHEVVALQRVEAKAADSNLCSVIETDLSRPLDKSKLPGRCDAVIHLAQSQSYRDFPAAVGDIFRINTAATVELADYALGAGAGAFFYASTGSVYVPDDRPIPETGRVEPGTFYAASKLAAELLLSPFGDMMAITTARLFYLYGPGQRAVLFSNIANKVRSGMPVDLKGDVGLQITPTFSADTARIVRRAVEDRWSGVYNVASSEIVTLRDLAVTIGKILAVEPYFKQLTDQPQAPLVPDVSKLKRRLGGIQFTPLEEGLRSTLIPSQNV